MKIEFKSSFKKSLKKIKSQKVFDDVYNTIISIENTNNIFDIKTVKKIVGHTNYYRIRIGNYRIGVKKENDIIYFIIIAHRKDIYKKFP